MMRKKLTGGFWGWHDMTLTIKKHDRENGSIWGVCLVVLGPRWGTPGSGVEFGVGMT